jgi:hypothetical protein
MHRVRKTYGAHVPDQMAGWDGFGMYTPSNPTPPPRALHVDRHEPEDEG